MEILTEGDGSSIGKGFQRTTRDVRKYTWNGLEITDDPGIGAFEGDKSLRMYKIIEGKNFGIGR